MLCIVCRAPLDLRHNCSRCGLTTESMRRTAQAAAHMRRLACNALQDVQLDDAEYYAKSAQLMHNCREGAELQWLVELFVAGSSAEAEYDQSTVLSR